MNELAHIGVLGMRWGRRKRKIVSVSRDHAVASKIKKKKLSEMSNDEIRTLSNRIQLEQQYKNLNPSKVKKGKMAVNTALITIGQIAGAIGSITTLAVAGKKVAGYFSNK